MYLYHCLNNKHKYTSTTKPLPTAATNSKIAAYTLHVTEMKYLSRMMIYMSTNKYPHPRDFLYPWHKLFSQAQQFRHVHESNDLEPTINYVFCVRIK